MSYKNGQIPSSDLVDIEWTDAVRDFPGADSTQPQLLKASLESLARLNAEFRRVFKRDLDINSAYRPRSVQELYWKNRGRSGWPKTTAVPGTSVHGWALAVDIGGLGGFDTKEYAWLAKNAGRYGWWQPTQYRKNGRYPEYWHWEYRSARDRYRRRNLKITRELDRRTVRAIGRATNRRIVTNTTTKGFWIAVQKHVNKILKGRGGWTPLVIDGSPGPLTWDGIRRSLVAVNRVHKPSKRASRARIIYCWQKALNAGKSNKWSQKRSKYYD